ncbi:MAG: phospholipid/cholesterol/gamma-HCH transport system substrate-binding protein [Actinomycetota bacterium]|nr:phospholipid/cholesterol/gamma-HCH transport system substrate-binding protein [Actinomycetota bacterium]
MNISKAMLVKVLMFATLCVILTIALGVKLANSRLFSDTYSMAAEFEDATGVLKGDAVKLAGVDIGRVESAEMEDGKAIVKFNLDKSVQLPTDSEIAIRWRNVLGQRYLYVYPGTDSKVFEEEALIPADQTRDVNDIGDFINRVGPILKAIDPERANAFLDAVNTALSGNEGQVRKLLDDGAKLAQTLGSEDDEIKGLITSADTVTGAYASQDKALGEIFDNLDDLGIVLRRRTQDINTLLVDFADVQEELEQVLVESRSNIDASLSGLEQTTGTLASHRKNLGKTLKSLPLGIMGYHQTSSWGEYFNVRIIKLLVQDSNSQDLATQSETGQQHGQTGGKPKTGDPCVPCKDGAEGSSGGESAGSGTSGVGGSSGRHDGGAVGIESILRFVLSGESA